MDATIERLARKRFAADPVVGERYSRITSIVSSAYKRHGAIIEHPLLAALTSAPHLQVWSDRRFRVSPEADMLAGNDASAFGNLLRYGADNFTRTIQVDVLVHNQSTDLLGAYESKRGFGYHDSGKKRSMLRDLRCLQMLPRSYGETQGLHVRTAEAHIIFYYGQCSVGRPWALTRADLDEHFGASIAAPIERGNAYFRERLDDLLAAT
ncbi:MAG: hypothetical protein HY521_12870 [Proteobacteria bacterium]|nr:hypothetical protein [Pseudomonadota bacterium]